MESGVKPVLMLAVDDVGKSRGFELELMEGGLRGRRSGSGGGHGVEGSGMFSIILSISVAGFLPSKPLTSNSNPDSSEGVAENGNNHAST